MRRRPLCGAALLLLLVCMALPPSLWMHEGIEEGTTGFTGVVGRREEKGQMQVLYLKDTSISGARWILVYLKNSNTQYFIGNTLQIQGTIKTYKEPGNPGQFNALLYYQMQKIDAMCFASQVKLLNDDTNVFREGLYTLRGQISAGLERTLGERDAAIIKAMLLGERGELPRETKDLYQRSGISHLLAISGLHISILGMGLYQGLRKLGLPYGMAGVPVLLLMGCYGIFVGAGVSTLRALTMFFLAVGADFLGRTYDMRSALGISALWLLAEQPLYARNSAFLLSFGAVFGLAEITPVLAEMWGSGRKEKEDQKEKQEEWQRRKSEKAGAFLKNSLSACLGIQMMTLPVLLHSFYEVPVYAPLLNLAVLPLMGPLLTAGILCGLLGMCLPAAAVPAAWLCRIILGFVEGMAGFSCRIPGALYCGGCPEKWQIAVYYMGLGAGIFLWKRKKCRKKRSAKEVSGLRRRGLRIWGWIRRTGVYGMVYTGCLLALLWRNEPEFQMTMLDVGQGDGIFFQTRGGNTYLVDGGSSSETEVGQYILEPFFKYNGKNRIDYLLVSHLDADHISGIGELLREGLLEIGCLVLPGTTDVERAAKLLEMDEEEISVNVDEAAVSLLSLAGERGVPVWFIRAGDSLQEGDLLLKCLGPQAEYSYENRNAGSMVLSLEYKELCILLTGDLEGSGERQVLEGGFPCKAYDILKIAHHGSKYTTGEDWLSRVQPKLSLISCGEDNSYGHPHEELLERLRAAKSLIYQTRESGAVEIESSGKKYRVKTWKSP